MGQMTEHALDDAHGGWGFRCFGVGIQLRWVSRELSGDDSWVFRLSAFSFDNFFLNDR